ncbi:hypothetical protein ACFFLM_24990 [Deinococcus oregonensis]|uniref:Uncharacterized protein n=1 Tax=Deinococcus oregonensis TaxID=1805970 RepID=A0ABV6B613_9DEIO
MSHPSKLSITVHGAALPTVNAELQVVHVSPNGIIDFPNHSAFEVLHLPGSPEIFSQTRRFEVDLDALKRYRGTQLGHMYGVSIHSTPRSLQFLDGMVMEINGPGIEISAALQLSDHAVLLGLWWQQLTGEWAFEHSGAVLDTDNHLYQRVFLMGQYAERFKER